MYSIKKWKIFLGILATTLLSVVLLSVVRGRPVTWYFVGFVTVFMVIVMGFALIIDYFFGERIRKNPRTLMIVLAVFWSFLLINAIGNLIKNYTAGKGIDWLYIFVGAGALIAGIGWLRQMRLQKKQ